MIYLLKVTDYLKEKLSAFHFATVLQNISWLVLDKVLRLGVGLIVGVWVARYLGPLLFGSWNYGTAIVSIFGPVATLGLDSIIIKRLIASPEEGNTIMGTAFFLRIMGAGICVFLSFLIAYIFDSLNSLLLFIVLITSSSFIFQSFDVIDCVNQSKLESKKTVIIRGFAFLSSSLLKVVLISFKASLIYFVWLTTLEAVIGSIGLLYFYKFSNFRLWVLKKGYIMDLLNESWPLILSGLIIMVYMRIDQIMIGRLMDEKSVGVYTAAVKIAEIWYFIPTVIASSVFPSLIDISLKNTSEYHLKIQKLFRLMVIIALPVCFLVSFFSSKIVMLVYGTEFIDASQALTVNVWASVFVFLGVASGNVLVINGLKRQNFIKSLIGAGINISLNFILIPTLGINGAAWATLIAQAFASTFYFAFFKETRFIYNMQMKSLLFLRNKENKNGKF